MELQQLRDFVAVADTGTAGSPTSPIIVAQPALAQQLRQLEGELGVELFVRSAGRLVLSEAGASLLPWARRVLESASGPDTEQKPPEQSGLGRVSIAASAVSLADIVSPFAAAMDVDDPVIDVVVADGTSIADMLRNGADLAIGTRPDPSHSSTPLPPLPVWAFVREDDPWAGRRRVSFDELFTRSLVVLPPGYAAREALDAVLALRSVGLDDALEAADGQAAQAIAADGRGVALVSDRPRFGLVPVAVDVDDGQLSIRLTVGWQYSGARRADLERLAHRLVSWVTDRYAIDGAGHAGDGTGGRS